MSHRISSLLAADNGEAELLPIRRDQHQSDQIRLRVLDGPDAGRNHQAAGARVLVGTHQSHDLALTSRCGLRARDTSE